MVCRACAEGADFGGIGGSQSTAMAAVTGKYHILIEMGGLGTVEETGSMVIERTSGVFPGR